MFNGFSREAADYFLSVKFDNSKKNFENLKDVYKSQIKNPLLQLHAELTPVVLKIDGGICVRPGRCVSGAYNDARFSKNNPIKEYMYLHFCAETGNNENVPGFFMDASHDGYRYGLMIYRSTPAGMRMIRNAAYEKRAEFIKIINGINKNKSIVLDGENYKTDHFPDAALELKEWLNKKHWRAAVNHPVDEIFLSDKLPREIESVFNTLAPMYKFILRLLM